MNMIGGALFVLSGLLAAAGRPVGVPRLTAPAALAAGERVQEADSGYEGVLCAVGLAYGTGDDALGLPGGMQLLSTSADRLRAAQRLGSVDSFLTSGRGGARIGLDEVLCTDAAFGHVADVGVVVHPSFDTLALTVGGFAQDLCGPAEVIALGRKAGHYTVMRLRLDAAAPAYTCDAQEPNTEADCTKRDVCAQAFLKTETSAAAIRARVSEVSAQLQFSK